MIQTLSSSNNTLWQFKNKILNKKNTIPPLKTSTGKKFSPFEKAETLAKHFEDTFKPNDSHPHNLHQTITQIATSPNYDVPSRIRFTSPQEITNIIKALPNKKAPGHDRINNKILKNLPNQAIAFLNNIYNSSLRTGYFPLLWKHSIVIPIPKPNKNPSNVENYRPISLLPSLSKILEKIIQKRLNNYLNKNGIIPRHQFGFTEKLSTTHQLLRITEHIHTAFQRKLHTISTFLDISQAYDRVWHEGLMYKLKINGTPKYLTNIINSFISNRTFAVSIDKHLSNPKPILAGLPQGSPLSPILFNIYTADIPTSNTINIAQFADDTALYCSSTSLDILRNTMQQYLNQISAWSNKWKIKLNPSKSTAKIFSLKTISTPPPLTLNNNIIPWTPQNKTVRYLGLHLDTRLNWKEHINIKTQQTKVKLIQLKPLINNHSKITIENAKLIYTTVIRPLMLYACPVWINAAKTNIHKLQVIQNKFLRTITNAPWFITNKQLHKEIQIKPIIHHITKLSHNFYNNLPSITQLSQYNLGKAPRNATRIKNRFPKHVFYIQFANLDDSL